MVRFSVATASVIVLVILVCSRLLSQVAPLNRVKTSPLHIIHHQTTINTIDASTSVNKTTFTGKSSDIKLSVNKGILQKISKLDQKSYNARNHQTRSQSLVNPQINEAVKIVMLNKVEKLGSFYVINKPVRTTMRYAVTCCYVQNDDYNYIFSLPMTVLTWSRAGFGTIIILIGTIQDWLNHPVLNISLEALINTNSTIIFLPSMPIHAVMISQVARLFVVKLLPWNTMEDTYIITTDTDIWPINITRYRLQKYKQILSLNSECCGRFQHKGRTFKMLPMCNIGMTVKTWRSVMKFSNADIIQDSQEIVDYFKTEFGEEVNKPVTKGGNKGWYMDQMMISIRIFEWTEIHDSDLIDYIPRNTLRDRIDRAPGRWTWGSNDIRTTANYKPDYRPVGGKNDAHILNNSYRSGVWERVSPLLSLLLTNQTCQYLQQYRMRFLRATESVK